MNRRYWIKRLPFMTREILRTLADCIACIIDANPNNVQALHFLGVAEAAAGNIVRAKSLIDHSLQSNPVKLDFVENYAAVLCRAREYGAVIELCDRFLPVAPVNVALMHAR